MNKTWSRKLETNIIKCYLRASEYDRESGYNWYTRAHQDAEMIAEKYGILIWQSVGIIAALSPGNSWGRNLLDAEELISAYVRHLPIPQVGPYGRRNVNKALAILNGEYPLAVLPETGPKVRSFFTNMLFPLTSDSVTIDRHAKAIAYDYGSKVTRGASDDQLSLVRISEYEYIAWHYRIIAKRYGLIPNQLQAIVWVCWRRLRGNLDQADLFV